MANASNSSDCYNFTNHTNQLIIDLSVNGATTSIGAVSALTAIVLILVAKAHKEFIYRLILYMAVDAEIGCLASIITRKRTLFRKLIIGRKKQLKSSRFPLVLKHSFYTLVQSTNIPLTLLG